MAPASEGFTSVVAITAPSLLQLSQRDHLAPLSQVPLQDGPELERDSHQGYSSS